MQLISTHYLIFAMILCRPHWLTSFYTLPALALLLSGCVSTAVSVQPASELAKTNGFAIATYPSMDKACDLKLRALNTGRIYNLEAKPEYGVYAVGIWAPPGEYEILVNENKIRETIPEPIRLQAGMLIDLGLVSKFSVGGYKSILVPTSHHEADRVTRAAVDALTPLLKYPEAAAWRPSMPLTAEEGVAPAHNLGLVVEALALYERSRNEPPLNKKLEAASTNAELARIARTTQPPRTDRVARDARGRLLYGADFGQIRVRDVHGQWSSFDTGTVQSVSAVTVKEQIVVAGTNHGLIRESFDGGLTWRTMAQLASTETIIGIDYVGAQLLVTTTELRSRNSLKVANKLKVYSAAAASSGSLSLLKEIPLSEEFMVVDDVVPRVITVKDALYVSATEVLMRLNVAKMEWSEIKAPHDTLLFDVSPEMEVMTSFLPKGMFSKLSISVDKGATWSALKPPPYTVYDIVFAKAGTGYATRWNMRAFSRSAEFLEFDAQHGTWIKKFEAPEACTRLLRDHDRKQRFCVTSGGSILAHTAGNWTVEFGVN